MLPRPNSMYLKKWFARTWKFRSCRKGMTGGIKDVKKSPKLEGYYIQIGEKYGAHLSSPTFPNPYAMHLFTKKNHPLCGFWYRVKVTHHISAHELGSWEHFLHLFT